MDGRTDGWMDEWMDGWMDCRMVNRAPAGFARQTGKQASIIPNVEYVFRIGGTRRGSRGCMDSAAGHLDKC